MDIEAVKASRTSKTQLDDVLQTKSNAGSNLASRVNPILERQTQTKETEFSVGPWRVVQCLETGFVYLDNPPDYASFEQDYAWEKTYSLEKQRREASEPVRTRFSAFVKGCRAKMKRGDKVAHETVRFLSQHRGTGRRLRVVDIGCGEGRHAATVARKAMNQYGLDVEPIGLEISDYLAGVAHRRLGKYGGRVIHKPAIEGLELLEDSSVDALILLSFLEHEVNPAPLMRLCAQKLAHNGVMIIKVPNFNSWNRLRRNKNWCGFRYPDHVSYFTPETLKILFAHTGLQIERMNFFDTLPTNDNMWVIVRPVAR